MNSRVYLFGQLGNGYTQYPTNHTQAYFQEFEHKAKAQTAVCVRREGDLMLYQYLRRLYGKKTAQNEYIGIAIVFNGVILTDIAPLFHICEDAITNLVVNGKILEFTEDGNITSNINQLYQADIEFAQISEYLSARLNALSALFEKLPPSNYAIGTDRAKSFSIEDDMVDIIQATREYAKVYILKDVDYNSASLSSFSGKLHRLNQEKETALQKVKKQQEEITSLKRKQKNITLVLILILIISCGGIGILLYVSNTNNQIRRLQGVNNNLQTAIDKNKQTIQLQRDSIGELTTTNYQQELEISTLSAKNKNLTSEKAQLNDDLNKIQKKLTIANAKIEQFEKENREQKITITTLQNRLNGGYTSSQTTSASSDYSSNIVGANISSSITAGYDKTYALWLYARKPLKINSFYIKSNKSGYVTIGLYKSSNVLIASKRVYVSKGDITKVPSSFTISNAGNYYLAIEKHNGIELSYHNSSTSEYSKYKSGYLQILGFSPKGEQVSAAKTSYYQYFYYISYSLL